ncbi:membrane-spanning 4-domains subfamily A member 4A-like [Brachionichthys hirsutus]|uniref:membrane-spanning 4-domains subfamily A member 4A-like n=1 Tax=Brachionichthys hirsutus TaxID=412623 RepID=UPI003604780E
MSMSTSAGQVVVVTHVHHQLQEGGHQHQPPLGTAKFGLGQPLVLGTIQILIGLIQLLFGIFMAINADSLGVYSGIFAWGTLIYIIAGSLTVSAGKSFNRCLVNGSLGVSVAAATISIPGIIIYSMDVAGMMLSCWYLDENYTCHMYKMRMRGFAIVITVLQILMLAVSVTIAGYACNATCKCNTETVRYMKDPPEYPQHLPDYESAVVDHPVLTP